MGPVDTDCIISIIIIRPSRQAAKRCAHKRRPPRNNARQSLLLCLQSILRDRALRAPVLIAHEIAHPVSIVIRLILFLVNLSTAQIIAKAVGHSLEGLGLLIDIIFCNNLGVFRLLFRLILRWARLLVLEIHLDV